MHTPETAPENPRFARLRGHVAADLARLLSTDSAKLVDNGKKVTTQIGEALGHLAPKRKEEIGNALAAFVDAITGAIAEQTSGELFTNIHELLAADANGFAVTVLSDALEMTEQMSAPRMGPRLDREICVVSDLAGCELGRELGCWVYAE